MNDDQYVEEVKVYWKRWAESHPELSKHMDDTMKIAAKTGNDEFQLVDFEGLSELDADAVQRYYKYHHGLNVSIHKAFDVVSHWKYHSNGFINSLLLIVNIFVVIFGQIETFERNGYIVNVRKK
jgi:hypothetical protein